MDKISALQLTAQVGSGSVFIVCCRFATYPCASNCCKLGKHTMTEMLESRYCCWAYCLISSDCFRFWKMECSTQGSSSVAAWGQEWIPNQRVGGYLVSARYTNHIPLLWDFWSLALLYWHFPVFPLVLCNFSRFCSVVWQSMSSMMSALPWNHFTILPTTLFSVPIFLVMLFMLMLFSIPIDEDVRHRISSFWRPLW
jgi:hypothetical protein